MKVEGGRMKRSRRRIKGAFLWEAAFCNTFGLFEVYLEISPQEALSLAVLAVLTMRLLQNRKY
jgi:hypothetical protein